MKPIPPVQFGCPLFFQGELFDCRILLDQIGISLEPGSHYTVPIKFLNPILIKPRLKTGTQFKLWEFRFFADGEVVDITDI